MTFLASSPLQMKLWRWFPQEQKDIGTEGEKFPSEHATDIKNKTFTVPFTL